MFINSRSLLTNSTDEYPLEPRQSYSEFAARISCFHWRQQCTLSFFIQKALKIHMHIAAVAPAGPAHISGAGPVRRPRGKPGQSRRMH